MAYIYKITNNINQRVYIGKTERTIAERWKEHKKDIRRYNNTENRPLYRAFNKYGVENFSIEEIEECDLSIINEREKYWIEYYGSYKNGYNATLGGEGKSFIDFNLVYKLYLETKSFSKVAEITGHDRQCIAEVIKANGGYIFPHATANMKVVACLDKDTEEILEVFPSIREAEKKYNTGRHISAVCSGKRKTAGGYKWKYL